MFEPYLSRWHLTPDGEPIVTHSSRLLPVRCAGMPALIGERCFDFANIFCNPDRDVASSPGRLARQADVVADAANLDRTQLQQWILAYAGLSAAWILGDREKPELDLQWPGLPWRSSRKPSV